MCGEKTLKSGSNRRWYVVATQPSRERVAVQQLKNQGFEVFLPLRKKTVRHSRRLLNKGAPLFPGYVFVSVDLETVRWRAINGTLGVKYILSAGDDPIALPHGFVETLIALVGADGCVTCSPDLKPGDKVELLAGPFASQVGELLSRTDSGRVSVLMEFLYLRVPVHTSVDNLLRA